MYNQQPAQTGLPFSFEQPNFQPFNFNPQQPPPFQYQQFPQQRQAIMVNVAVGLANEIVNNHRNSPLAMFTFNQMASNNWNSQAFQHLVMVAYDALDLYLQTQPNLTIDQIAGMVVQKLPVYFTCMNAVNFPVLMNYLTPDQRNYVQQQIGEYNAVMTQINGMVAQRQAMQRQSGYGQPAYGSWQQPQGYGQPGYGNIAPGYPTGQVVQTGGVFTAGATTTAAGLPSMSDKFNAGLQSATGKVVQAFGAGAAKLLPQQPAQQQTQLYVPLDQNKTQAAAAVEQTVDLGAGKRLLEQYEWSPELPYPTAHRPSDKVTYYVENGEHRVHIEESKVDETKHKLPRTTSFGRPAAGVEKLPTIETVQLETPEDKDGRLKFEHVERVYSETSLALVSLGPQLESIKTGRSNVSQPATIYDILIDGGINTHSREKYERFSRIRSFDGVASVIRQCRDDAEFSPNLLRYLEDETTTVFNRYLAYGVGATFWVENFCDDYADALEMLRQESEVLHAALAAREKDFGNQCFPLLSESLVESISNGMFAPEEDDIRKSAMVVGKFVKVGRTDFYAAQLNLELYVDRPYIVQDNLNNGALTLFRNFLDSFTEARPFSQAVLITADGYKIELFQSFIDPNFIIARRYNCC